MSITLEDVWRILHISITGELATYDRVMGEAVVCQVFPYPELEVYDGCIPWEDMADLYEPLPIVLSSIVGGLLCPDRRLHGIIVSWGQVIEQMVREGTRYAWGACVLAHLYMDLHEVVYHGITLLGVGITLLHIWAWENLPIMRPMCMRFRAIDQPYIYMYGGMMT